MGQGRAAIIQICLAVLRAAPPTLFCGQPPTPSLPREGGGGKRAARCLAVGLVAGLLFIAPAAAQRSDGEPDFLTIGGGAFDMNDDRTAGQFEFQIRLNNKFWIFKPQLGMFVTTDSAFYAYGGVLVDVFLGRRVVLSPSFSAGVFHDGDGKDLGSAIEFRSALELAYRFDDRSRLGIQFGHLSNASIDDNNPGEEFLMLNYSMPTTVFDR